MYHSITIMGTLGRDPELRRTSSGSPVCTMNVATSRKWKKDGTLHEETCWWRVTVWGSQGEACAEYLAKGRQVLVVGEMQPDRETGAPRMWTDKNGNARATFEVTARTVQFLRAAQPSEQTSEQSQQSTDQSSPPSGSSPDEGDDMPF